MKKGDLPRSRPFHCTPLRLKPAIAPNVGNSGTQFFSVRGLRLRYPLSIIQLKKSTFTNVHSLLNPVLKQHPTKNVHLYQSYILSRVNTYFLDVFHILF